MITDLIPMVQYVVTKTGSPFGDVFIGDKVKHDPGRGLMVVSADGVARYISFVAGVNALAEVTVALDMEWADKRYTEAREVLDELERAGYPGKEK